MGKPLMIQLEDEEKIELLKKKVGARTKVAIVRAGLRLLEQEVERRDRINQWKKAALLVSKQSREVNRAFQKYARLKHL